MTVKLDKRTHGLVGTYKAGCRCEPCRQAHTAYATSNPKQRAHRMARSRAAAFVIHEHPDVYKAYFDAALAECKAMR